MVRGGRPPEFCRITRGRRGCMTIRLHRGDLPDLSRYTGAVAIDTETMGLEPGRDRLCVVQLSPGDGSADVVQIGREIGPAPNLRALLADASKLKIFHFGRFDIAVLYKFLGVMPGPVYCTKIASRLARTYTDKHGLKDLVKDMLGKDISKQQQLTDWGAEQLTEAQVASAAEDVLPPHAPVLGRVGDLRFGQLLRGRGRAAPPCAQGEARRD